ncbi:MAG: cupin domain-containing protein, partial [Solirubrobacteraceae bacterium]
MPPRALAAPLHRHLREDEYSFVLEGRVGALLGDEVVIAGPGDLFFKPRNQWHTFWNAGDEPARILGDHRPVGLRAVLRRARRPRRRGERRPARARRALRAPRPGDGARHHPRPGRALRP